LRRWLYWGAWTAFSGGLWLAACGNDETNPPNTSQTDGGISSPDSTVPVPDAAQKRTSCLERPTDVPRPPTGKLPCDLIPPGLTL